MTLITWTSHIKQANAKRGYKIVGLKNGQAYSLWNHEPIDIQIGSVELCRTEKGLFLGTSQNFVLTYYSGQTDDDDLLLTYEYDDKDFLGGAIPGEWEGEFRVRRARLIAVEPVEKDIEDTPDETDVTSLGIKSSQSKDNGVGSNPDNQNYTEIESENSSHGSPPDDENNITTQDNQGEIRNRLNREFMEWSEKEELNNPNDDDFRQYLSEKYCLNLRDDGLVEVEWRINDETSIAIGNQPIVVFHVTSDALLPKIASEGLRPGTEANMFGQVPAGVYVSLRSTGAPMDTYAANAVSKYGGEPVMLEIKTTQSALTPDPDDADIESGKYQYVLPSVSPKDIINLGSLVKASRKTTWIKEAAALSQISALRRVLYIDNYASLFGSALQGLEKADDVSLAVDLHEEDEFPGSSSIRILEEVSETIGKPLNVFLLNQDDVIEDGKVSKISVTPEGSKIEQVFLDKNLLQGIRRLSDVLAIWETEERERLDTELIKDFDRDSEDVWESVESSVIDAVSYHEGNGVMSVRMKSGKVYTFKNVSINQYKDFMNSSSKGEYFSKMTRRRQAQVAKTIPPIFYHGTSSIHADRIRSRGLTNPILCDTPDKARYYALVASGADKGKPMVLTIPSASVDPSLLRYDGVAMDKPIKAQNEARDAALRLAGEEHPDWVNNGIVTIPSTEWEWSWSSVGSVWYDGVINIHANRDPNLVQVGLEVTPEMDKAYLEAVERRDYRTAQRMILDALGVQPVSSEYDRGDEFHAPADPGSGAPAFDLTVDETYPDDVYSLDGLRQYSSGDPKMDQTAWSIISHLQGHPEFPIKVYRAVDKDSKVGIQPGDWVTIVRPYAKEHGEGNIGSYKIISKTVRAKDLYTSGDSWLEWGYHPQSQPYPRSVRRSPSGNIIPLSERVRNCRMANPHRYASSQVGISFRNECVGAHDGQTDCVLRAIKGGKPVGRVEYSIFEGEPSVSWLEVEESERRSGVGTALMHELQGMFPKSEIALGYSVNNGNDFVSSLNFDFIPDPDHTLLVHELNKVKMRIAELEQAMNEWYALPKDEQPAARAAVMANNDEWDKLNDRAYEIEQMLGTLKPGKKLISPKRGVEKLESVVNKHESENISIDVVESGGVINLMNLRVERGERKRGLGTAFMEDLCDYADRTGQDIELSLGEKEAGETTSKTRLIAFYKRFGFVRNFGKTADYTRNCQMYRKPKSKRSASGKNLVKIANTGCWSSIAEATIIDGMDMKEYASARKLVLECQQKKVIAAAIIMPNGTIWTGTSHADAFAKAIVQGDDDSSIDDARDDLFVTSDGRLIGRDGSMVEFGISVSEEAPWYRAYANKTWFHEVQSLNSHKDELFKIASDGWLTDDYGDPMMVWHGSGSDPFTQFDPSMSGLNFGDDSEGAFFFTDSADEANFYRNNALEMDGRDEGGFVGAFNIRLQNPYTPSDNEILSNGMSKTILTAKQLGHDGIVYEDKNGTVYAVFSPSQIRQRQPEKLGGFLPWEDGEGVGKNYDTNRIHVQREGNKFDIVFDSETIGKAFIRDVGDGAYILEAIDIDEEWQRKVYGTILLSEIAQFLKNSGAKSLSSSNEGSGTVQILDKVFGRNNVKHFMGGEEISFDEAVKVMDVDFGRTRSVVNIPPRFDLNQASENPSIRNASGTAKPKESTKTTDNEFNQWFAGSKVVDGDGKPLAVYHGTGKDFNKFNPKMDPQGIFWFTSNKGKVESGEVGATGKGVVMELYLSIKNPAGWDEYDKYGIGQLIGMGYDGLLLPDGDETTFVIFNPNQARKIRSWKVDRTSSSAKIAANTTDFDKWFSGSKVIDEDGRPLPVFHGTLGGDFDKFDFSVAGRNMADFGGSGGMFFTDSLEVAESYADPDNNTQRRDNMSSALMSLERRRPQLEADVELAEASWPEPYKDDDGWHCTIHAIDQWGSEYTYETEFIYDEREEAIKDGYKCVEDEISKAQKRLAKYEEKEQAERNKFSLGSRVIRAYLKIVKPLIIDYEGSNSDLASMAKDIARARKSGYDGVIFENIEDSLGGGQNPSTLYVVFSNEQIMQVPEQKTAASDTWLSRSAKKTDTAKGERGIWYHGTRGRNLRSIIAEGLIPDPKEREWSEDKSVGFYQPSRKSLGGIYVTRNLMTAISSMNRSRDRKNRESGVIIMCELQPRSLIADEDDVTYATRYPMGTDSDWLVTEAYMARELGTNKDFIETSRSNYVDKTIREMKEVRSIKMHPSQEMAVRDILKRTWDVALDRQAVYAFREASPSSQYDWNRTYFNNCGEERRDEFYRHYDDLLKNSNGDDAAKDAAYRECVRKMVPPRPDSAQAEENFAKAMDDLTRALKNIPRPGQSASFLNTARSMEPIGFSGSNRIVCIAEIIRPPDPKDFYDYVKYTWGQPPEDFVKQWTERVGELRMAEEQPWWDKQTTQRSEQKSGMVNSSIPITSASHHKTAKDDPLDMTKIDYVQPIPDENAQDDEWRAYWNRKKEWEQAAKRALSLGQLEYDTAYSRGYVGSGHDKGWEPLPPKLYHVTTAKSAVMNDSLKTRSELGQDFGKGLGGGESDSISFTDDIEVARAIFHSILEMRQVARFELKPEELIEAARTGEGADHPYLADMLREDGTMGHELKNAIEGYYYDNCLARPPDTEHEWEGVGEGWKDAAGNRRYVSWRRRRTEDEQREANVYVYKLWSMSRERAGGLMNPLFFGSDIKAIASVPIEEIAILEYAPVANAKGYKVGALNEWRTGAGEAVRLIGEVTENTNSPRATASTNNITKSAGTYWGTAGSGILYVCPEDQTAMLLLRSGDVMDPNVWGIPGGAVKGTEGIYDAESLEQDPFDDETLKSSAYEEVCEEVGIEVQEGDLLGTTEFRDGGFLYKTFIVSVTLDEKHRVEEQHRLNWESSEMKWWPIDQLPEDLHHGVAHTINEWRPTWRGASCDTWIKKAAEQQDFPFMEDPKIMTDSDNLHYGQHTVDALNDLVENYTGRLALLSALQKFGYDFEEVEFPTGRKVIVVNLGDEKRVIDDYVYGYGSEEAVEWVSSMSDTEIYSYYKPREFSDDFWDGSEFLSEMWHGTDKANIDDIKREGLQPRDKSRGIANRFTGPGVFLSANFDETEYSYESVIGVDFAKMRDDGYTPLVEKEEPCQDAELRDALANKIGLDEFQYEVEAGIFPDTIIVRGNIPPKYLIFKE